MTLTLETKVKTRDGRKARIIAVDRKGTSILTVVALVMGEDGIETAYYYLAGGGYYTTGTECDFDLIPDTTEVMYANAYKTNQHVLFTFHNTLEDAKDGHDKYSGTLKLTLDGNKLIGAEVVEDDNGN